MKKGAQILRLQAAILCAGALVTSCGRAQGGPSTETIFSGRNIYSPSIVFDASAGKYKMWYGGWQTQSDYPHDRIYYRESKDASIWSAPTTVLVPDQLPIANSHVNDPTVVMQTNAKTKTVQYTMFYTVCVNPCTKNANNQIWSSVSSDGLTWKFNKPLIRHSGAAVPSVVLLKGSDPVIWRVYFSRTSEANDAPKRIYAVDVNGDRDPVGAERTVFTHKGAGVIANPEVRQVGRSWHLLFNVYHKQAGAKRDTGDIYLVSSDSPIRFSSASARPLVENDPGNALCASVAPALLTIGNKILLQFGQANYQRNGVCDFSVFHSLRQVRADTAWLEKGYLRTSEP